MSLSLCVRLCYVFCVIESQTELHSTDGHFVRRDDYIQRHIIRLSNESERLCLPRISDCDCFGLGFVTVTAVDDCCIGTVVTVVPLHLGGVATRLELKGFLNISIQLVINK